MIRLTLFMILSLAVSLAARADAEGQAVLDALAKKYGNLPGYGDEGRVTSEFKVGGESVSLVQPVRIKFSKPNLVDIDTENVRLVSNGKTQTVIVGPLKTLETEPAPLVFRPAMIADNAMASGILALPSVQPARLILSLLSADGPAPLMAELAMTPKLEAERELGGVKYQILSLDSATGADLRVWIAPSTSLIAFIDILPADSPGQDPVPGVKVEFLSQRWSSPTVKTEQLAPASFAVESPKGFIKLAALADGPKLEKPKAEPDHKLVGKPAPDFTLTVLDGPGKTKTMTKAQLAGKVVVLDFWATWCGPCIEELPDIQAMITSYDKAKRDVLFVALSIDEDDDVRKLVEKKLKDLELDLSGLPTGIVALDTDGKVAKTYDVEAIPFVIIMDRQGIIRHVHVGLTKRDVFQTEIDALLDMKP